MTTQTKDPARSLDEKLMRYLDDELDDIPRAEVERLLSEDERWAQKLTDLCVVGDLLRESCRSDERGDVADEVMAAIEEGRSAETPAERPAAEVIPFINAPKHHIDEGAPANDNSRSIFTLVAIAAAIAAGFFFWSRATEQDMSVAISGPSATMAPERSSALTLAQRGSAKPPVSPQPEEEDEPGVEVASVDFGSLTGSVFYVYDGTEKTPSTTAVLWVTDDAGEDK